MYTYYYRTSVLRFADGESRSQLAKGSSLEGIDFADSDTTRDLTGTLRVTNVAIDQEWLVEWAGLSRYQEELESINSSLWDIRHFTIYIETRCSSSFPAKSVFHCTICTGPSWPRR